MLDTLNQLSQWQNKVNLEEFKYIFGKELGIHLWSKFDGAHKSLLGFWNLLDIGNRKILASHIQDIVDSNTEKISTKKYG